MQQGIYCIDLSHTPPLLVCAKYDSGTFIVEPSQELIVEAPAKVANGEVAASALQDLPFAPLAQQARQILGDREQDWLGPIVLLSGHNYLSLNLDLPISDHARVGKVIDMEVQDLVPFESQDFVLHHRLLGPGKTNAQDIHIAALPKTEMQNLLLGARSAEMEPLMVCSASSAMVALYKLFDDSELEHDCLLLHLTSDFCYLVTILDRQARFDRVLDLKNLYGGYSGPRDRFSLLLQQITLTVRHISARYQRELKTIYLLNADQESLSLLKSSALNLKELGTPSKLKCSDTNSVLGAAACSMAAGIEAKASDKKKGVSLRLPSVAMKSSAFGPFVDFRTREYSYRVPLKRFMSSAKRLLPWFGLTVALICLSVAAVYQLRVRYLASIRSHLKNQIGSTLNDTSFNPAPGEELTALLQRIRTLDASLKDLGSPSRLNALYVLSKLSRTINRKESASVRLISIKGPRVKIEGEAPDYAYVEELERDFNRLLRRSKDTDKQRRKQIYCDVKKGESRSAAYGTTAKQFSFELTLCD